MIVRLWRWIKENVHGNGWACLHGYCSACAHDAAKRGVRYEPPMGFFNV